MLTNNYVSKSLELHLFFGRIMKEHSLFLKAGFTPANPSFIRKADYYMKEFERLLDSAISLTNGLLPKNVRTSGEIVTEFTMLAEHQTEKFTGIPINSELTARELHLINTNSLILPAPASHFEIRRLNRRALKLLDGLIDFKESILNDVLTCEMFTVNYPLLIEHIIREAKLYREYVGLLERDGDLTDNNMKDVECFWNQIMMEHALFIRGLLDPTETELLQSANDFANKFAVLLESCRNAQDKTLTQNSLEETIKLRDFKAAGTKGIEECKIRSIILPLLADHVLREANHYIRLLKS